MPKRSYITIILGVGLVVLCILFFIQGCNHQSFGVNRPGFDLHRMETRPQSNGDPGACLHRCRCIPHHLGTVSIASQHSQPDGNCGQTLVLGFVLPVRRDLCHLPRVLQLCAQLPVQKHNRLR